MITNGIYVNSGRPTDKARNLRRFTEQWAEFEDEEALFGEDDAEYIGETLHMRDYGLGRYHALADALEV